MATIFTHGIAAAAIGSAFSPNLVPRRLWAAGILCAIVPDADVLGLALAVPYESFWGHRGFTHSLVFAALLAAGMTWGVCFSRPRKPVLFCYLLLATASHGVLDALTDGGLGVALLSPFENSRWFFPWTPIPVSPIGARFFGPAGLHVATWEMVLVWVPALLVIALTQLMWRRRRQVAPMALGTSTAKLTLPRD
jgi:inner membrane protein